MTIDSDIFVGVTDRQLAVARLGGFPLNIKACTRYVLADLVST